MKRLSQITFLVLAGALLWSSAGGAEQAGWKRGQYLPDIAYQSAAGEKTSLHKQRGKVALVKFWASWCPSCGKEWPIIQQIFDEIGDHENVEFVSLSLYEPYAISAEWVGEKGYTVPVYDSFYEERDSANPNKKALTNSSGEHIDYQPSYIPGLYILDPSGKITTATAGRVKSKKWIMKHIANALTR